MSNIFLRNDNKNVFNNFKIKQIKFDLILTDPPYNVSRKHQLGFSNMGRSGMNYGDWDYDFNQVNWLSGISEILKDNGSIIIFNDWKNMGMISKKLEDEGFIVKDLLRWEKRNPMPRNVNRRYVTDCEYAIWAVKKNAKWTFNKLKEIPYIKPSFQHSIVTSKHRIHLTQKPQKLLEEIIAIHTNENDIILDPFAGSGSTGMAAQVMKRKFIMIEKNKEIYEKAKERFQEISTTL